MAERTGRVAVIGAGIVGVACALELQRAGRAVTLIDRQPPGTATSFGNGGVLAACANVPVTGPGLIRKVPRMLTSRDAPLFVRWRHLPRALPFLSAYLGHSNAAQTRRIAAALAPLVGDSLSDHLTLAADTPAARHIRGCDYLYIYPGRAGFEADAFAWELRAAAGIRWSSLEGADVTAAIPGLAGAAFAVRMGGHGVITDPGEYVGDLARAFAAGGGEVVRAKVTGIALDNGRATGLRLGGETRRFSGIVVAGGAWSAGLLAPLGLKVPLESERGYHIDLIGADPAPPLPMMMTQGKFVVTPMAGRVRLAGIVEFGGLEAPPSRAPFALLRRAIARAMPGMRWEEEREWMGHRPALPDSLPMIGPVPGLAGLHTAFGHHHVGLTSGPATGRIIAQLLTGARPNIDLAPYAPGRFQ